MRVRRSRPIVLPAAVAALLGPALASSALAAISSCRSTSLGISASSGGRWIPSRAAIAAPATKSTHSFGNESVS